MQRKDNSAMMQNLVWFAYPITDRCAILRAITKEEYEALKQSQENQNDQ